jgi:hypothetical protein
MRVIDYSHHPTDDSIVSAGEEHLHVGSLVKRMTAGVEYFFLRHAQRRDPALTPAIQTVGKFKKLASLSRARYRAHLDA